MKFLLLALALALNPLACSAADIASVNFKAIKDDLRDYYFSKPENAAIKQQFQAATLEEKKKTEGMQKAIAEGKSPIDMATAMKAGLGAADRYQLERKIDADLKKELYLIVSSLGLKYELIYDASDAATIIFAKSQVDDVTTTVKQAIIDLGQKK